MVIKNCEITKSDAIIICPYIDSKNSPDFKKYKRLNECIEIATDSFYSMCYGSVYSVEKNSNNRYVVTVRFDSSTILRYCNLNSVDVKTGQYIHPSDKVGDTSYGRGQFEYATQFQCDSNWPVRIEEYTYYKHDPLDVLTGKIILQCPLVPRGVQ